MALFFERAGAVHMSEWERERETTHPFPLYTICLDIVRACVRACSQLDAKTTVTFCLFFVEVCTYFVRACVRAFLCVCVFPYDLISLCCPISLTVYIFYIVECFAIQRQNEFNSIEFGLVHQYIYIVLWGYSSLTWSHKLIYMKYPLSSRVLSLSLLPTLFLCASMRLNV